MADIKKKTIVDFRNMKAAGEKITWLTGYDYLTAKYEERAGVEMILVGDSAGNVMHGYRDTWPVTMDEMISHAQAVHRGAPNTFCVGDMPFMSYQMSNEDAIYNAGRFIKEAAMDAIKLEGYTKSCLERISAINDAGMVVIGHIGLTPQFAAQLGGNKAQGKSLEAAVKLVKAAKDIEAAGASMILVEGVPAITGKAIHDAVSIPVLGIGAGSYMDGQLLIFADMVGYFDDFTPKFVKKYGNVGEVLLKSFQDYCAEVKAGEFPGDGVHAYKIKEEEAKAIEAAIAAEFK